MKNLPDRLIHLAKAQLARVGVGVYRFKNREIRPFEHHPDELPLWFDYIHPGTGALVDFPASLGRARPLFRYGPDSNHPFVLAIRHAKARPKESQYAAIYEVLAEFYESFAPAGIADYLPLRADSPLRLYPPWAVIMPWVARTPEQYQDDVKGYTLAENRYYSKSSGFGIEKGWGFLGPVHPDKLDVETRRLLYLLQSIQSRGYRRHDAVDGDITAYILIGDDKEWAWRTTNGFHRAATLSGLGWEYIPIRPYQIIRRYDVSFWPGVRSGLFTVEEALRIFDLMMEGRYVGKFEAFERFLAKYA